MRILTQARDLGRRKARQRDALFVVEGIRATEELLESPLTVSGFLCGPQLIDTPRGAHLRAAIDRSGVEVSDVSEREFASAATTESPQGVLAIAVIPERTLSQLAGRDPFGSSSSTRSRIRGTWEPCCERLTHWESTGP
jgi:tRNA G18 (ribose-2'-O)-methylase SpoU